MWWSLVRSCMSVMAVGSRNSAAGVCGPSSGVSGRGGSRSAGISTSAALQRVVSGKFRITRTRSRPLTYEQANPPHFIAHRKSWNSWNTSPLKDGLRRSETAVEDEFIRRFLSGTWHSLFCSEIIIKRQGNCIRVGGIVRRAISPNKMCFLLGYSEELLSAWLHCPVTLELQTVQHSSHTVFKYI